MLFGVSQVEAFELQEVSYHIHVLSIRLYRPFCLRIRGSNKFAEGRGHRVLAMAYSLGSLVPSVAHRTRQVFLRGSGMDHPGAG